MPNKLVLVSLLILFSSFAFAETCERGWDCEGEFRRYRNSGCEILVEEYCNYGCNPDGCAEVKKCTGGWKCNGNFKEHVNEDCIADSKAYCAYGCIMGECLKKPEKKIEGMPYNESIANITTVDEIEDNTNGTIYINETSIIQNKTSDSVEQKKEDFFSRLLSSIKSLLNIKLNFYFKTRNG